MFVLSTKAKLECINTNQCLENSLYYVKTKFNNCFIIHLNKIVDTTHATQGLQTLKSGCPFCKP